MSKSRCQERPLFVLLSSCLSMFGGRASSCWASARPRVLKSGFFLPTNKVHVDSMSRVHVFQEDERLQERARGGTDVRPLMSLGSSREDRG